MNRYFTYENIQLWDPKNWEERALPVNNLIQWIGELDPLIETGCPVPEEMGKPVGRSASGFLGYLPPEEIAYWDSQGYEIELHHIWVAKWISLVPKCAVRNSGIVFPALLSMHQEHIDASWPAKTLRHCRKLADETAKNQMIMLIVVTDGRDVTRQYGNIIMEAISLYPIDHTKISLDISAVYASGYTLAQVPGNITLDPDGKVMENPDDNVNALGKFSTLDISEMCKGCASPNQGQLVGAEGHAAGNASYDSQQFVHTLAAKRVSESLVLEHRFKSHRDPDLLDYWKRMGLCYESHDYNHERYVTLTPRSALEGMKRIPIMLIFQEVYYYNDHLPIEAAAYWFEYCKIAAQGECMLLFYACEKYEHNKNMYNVFLDACKKYPIDTTRVYVTGYSHNSQTAARFAFDYPHVVTALAGGLPGSSTPETSLEEQRTINEAHRQIDMPCVAIVGCCEHNSPVGEPTFENSQKMVKIRMNAIIAGNCPERTEEDFKAAFQSADKATRMLGVPNDKSEVLYLEGVEHYIADVKNRDGKFHLRFGAIENAPHNPFPTKQILEWSFVRRFARDPVTHKILERY